MDLKSPFDDDAHTFADGAFARFMRMRKWFFLVGIFLVAIERGWWDFSVSMRVLALGGVPRVAFQSGLTIVGLYLLIQASIVVWQIARTYSEMVVARVQLAESITLNDLTRQIDKLRDQRSVGDTSQYDYLNDQISELRDRRAALRETHNKRAAPIKNSELWLDLMRIVPTLGFLAYAVLRHGTLAGVSDIFG